MKGFSFMNEAWLLNSEYWCTLNLNQTDRKREIGDKVVFQRIFYIGVKLLLSRLEVYIKNERALQISRNCHIAHEAVLRNDLIIVN